MKRTVLLAFICLLTATVAEAQDMKVIDFKLLENDLTANTHGTSKVDQNGETAAIIKIVTPEKGFKFDGGSLGIVAAEEHTGEIWLYVPRRSQKLIILHQDYGVLRDWFYPMNIEGGRTYEMLIDIGTGRYATITTSVAHSGVFIDGDSCGLSPVRKYLNYGRHAIRATKDHFEGETTAIITTNEEQNIHLIHVEMQDMSHLFGDISYPTQTLPQRYDIEGVEVGKQGTYLVKVSVYTNNGKVTPEQFKYAAVHGVIFRGFSGKGFAAQKPLTTPDTERQQATFFGAFWGSGDYLTYANIVNEHAGRIKLSKKEYKTDAIVSVSKDTLRKTLEKAHVIRNLNSGF